MIIRLLNLEAACNKVYVYDTDLQDAYHPSIGEYPFQVMITLGCYSTKHIFIDKKGPTLGSYNEKVRDLCILIKKKTGSESERSIPWWYRKFGNRTFLREPNAEDTDLRAITTTNMIHEKLFNLLRRRTQEYKGSRRPHEHNLNSIHKFAFKWIRQSGFYAVQTDKDGGFCLLPRELVQQMMMDRLDPQKYAIQSNINEDSIMKQLLERSHALGEAFEDDELTKYLERVLKESDSSKIRQTLLFNIKTHKGRGNIKFRLIHAATGHPGRAISNVIKLTLQKWEKNFPHIFHNTDEVLKMINDKKFENDTVMITMDIKDFYMVGKHEFLVENCFEHELDLAKKNAFKEALRTLLAHQYVTSELLPEVARTCVTIEGSGMGNIHSGEVAGSVFTKKVEIPFLDPDIQEIFDLRGYGRYRDDILVFIGYRKAENFVKPTQRQQKMPDMKLQLIKEISSRSIISTSM